jgi:uncharacterized protein DUF3846
MRAVLIPVEGEPREVEQNGLEDLQKLVGGWIEVLPFPGREDLTVYVNEEGKFGCDPNRTATRLLGSVLFRGDWIAGPCVICGFDPDRGRNLAAPAEVLEIARLEGALDLTP